MTCFIDTSTFKNAKQVVAFVGLNPRQFQSGSSVNCRTRISKTGNKDLRKALYFPSIVAMQFNPEIRTFYERL
jgi:transposase